MLLHGQFIIHEAGRPDRSIAVGNAATIGRDNDNDIVLEAITVSRMHAVLLHDSTSLQLVDLVSSNGTLVNGVPVLPYEPVQLNEGDIIQLGQVVLRYSAAPKQSNQEPVERLPIGREHHAALH